MDSSFVVCGGLTGVRVYKTCDYTQVCHLPDETGGPLLPRSQKLCISGPYFASLVHRPESGEEEGEEEEDPATFRIFHLETGVLASSTTKAAANNGRRGWSSDARCK